MCRAVLILSVWTILACQSNPIPPSPDACPLGVGTLDASSSDAGVPDASPVWTSSCEEPILVTEDEGYVGDDFARDFSIFDVLSDISCRTPLYDGPDIVIICPNPYLGEHVPAAPAGIFKIVLRAHQTVTVTETGHVSLARFWQKICGEAEECHGLLFGDRVRMSYTAGSDEGIIYLVAIMDNSEPVSGPVSYDIQFRFSYCGDGLLGGLEDCDDGNSMPGDGCSQTCQTEWGWECNAGNCTQIPAQEITTGLNSFSGIIPIDGKYRQWIDIPTQLIVSGTLDTDLLIRAFHMEGENGQVPSLFLAPNSIVRRVLDAGRYLWEMEVATPSPFSFDLDFSWPNCGDGILDQLEECDDAGNMPGDGCSPTCSIDWGYSCSGIPSVCMSVAKGRLESNETLSISGSVNSTEYKIFATFELLEPSLFRWNILAQSPGEIEFRVLERDCPNNIPAIRVTHTEGRPTGSAGLSIGEYQVVIRSKGVLGSSFQLDIQAEEPTFPIPH